jgi:hypothetical protein
MQHAAFGVHLVKFYATGFRHTQSMPEHQEQEATVASLVHASSGCLNQPLNFAPSEVLPAAVSRARVCALVPCCHFVENFSLSDTLQPAKFWGFIHFPQNPSFRRALAWDGSREGNYRVWMGILDIYQSYIN